MEIDVKEQLTEKLLQYMEQSKDFFIEQSPEIIQQIFSYHLYSTWFELCGCLVLLIALISLNLYCVFCPKLDDHGNREFLNFFGSYMPLLLAMPFIIASWSAIDKLLKLYLAPKYFLITLIMNMKG